MSAATWRGPRRMAFQGTRKLVVLGFGAIGSGLFAYEAQRTGGYAVPLMVDVRADLVAGLRAAGGRFRVNIARDDGVDVADIGPVNVADSSVATDRARVIEAIAAADELASALPSVAFYRSAAPNSPHRLLAEGLKQRTAARPLIVFCAENHRSAAALLAQAVSDALSGPELEIACGRARYVDTVIGKMSGVITDPGEVAALGLATVTRELPWAFLVEAFDRILVARVDADGTELHPGMPVLREVDDLAPFEDAKLLGHNATHALGAFLGQLLSLTLFADLRGVPGAMRFLRSAFIEESGGVLRRRWAGADELFTPAGYEAFVDDLLARMVNPHLADTIERAARDPRRKLGWDDRLVGLIRLGLMMGVPTPRYAMGVAAALDVLRREDGDGGSDAELLATAWPADLARGEVTAVLGVVEEGRDWLGRWRVGGFKALPPV
jgi:mannitol-1-phosphate 5-dehydrogenase